MVKTAHVLSVKMPLSSKVNCSIFSSVTIVCLEEAFLMKLSPLSQKRCKNKHKLFNCLDNEGPLFVPF